MTVYTSAACAATDFSTERFGVLFGLPNNTVESKRFARLHISEKNMTLQNHNDVKRFAMRGTSGTYTLKLLLSFGAELALQMLVMA